LNTDSGKREAKAEGEDLNHKVPKTRRMHREEREKAGQD
jgi:hypothetical protein